jgi:hypothetical protein
VEPARVAVVVKDLNPVITGVPLRGVTTMIAWIAGNLGAQIVASAV